MLKVDAVAQLWRAFNILVVSPTPTHPQDHGNRKRIYEICFALKQQGACIHFVHYPSEHDWRHARPVRWEEEMQAAWDTYQLIPPTRPLHTPAIGLDHEIDEWADPSVGHYLAWVCRVQNFDAIIVNYTWMSFCLESVPADIFKVCDTHDVFGGRRQLLEAHGIDAEFFHTSPSDEARGLKRADLVWAIKNSEQVYFEKELGLPNCLTMLHADPDRGWWREPPSVDGWLRAGVIGARNNINKRNLEEFLTEVLPMIERYMAPVKIVIAGSCSDDFRDWKHPNIEVLGRVPQVEDFYRGVDVVIAPMQFSTGLKIKVAEALASGAPLISHIHAMEGYPTQEPLHKLQTFSEMALALVRLAFDRSDLVRMASSSRACSHAIRHSVLEALETTRHQIMDRLATTICVVAPMAALDERSILYDHLVAAMDYLRFSARLVLYVIGNPAKASPNFLDKFDQRIRVYADPSLMSRLGDAAPESWSPIELIKLIETRGFERAYVLGDCTEHLLLGTGSLQRVFVRHDAIEIAGGNPDYLIDALRISVPVVVISSDTTHVMRWNSAYGIEAVVQIAFRRNGQFDSVGLRGRNPAYTGSIVVFAAIGDPLAQGVVELAGRYGRRAFIIDLQDLAKAETLLIPPSDGGSEDSLAIIGAADLVLDLLSKPRSLSAVLCEATERRGAPYMAVLGGSWALSLRQFPWRLNPITVADVLRTVSLSMADPNVLDDLRKESSTNLRSRIAADAGWTWLWHHLIPATPAVNTDELGAESILLQNVER